MHKPLWFSRGFNLLIVNLNSRKSLCRAKGIFYGPTSSWFKGFCPAVQHLWVMHLQLWKIDKWEKRPEYHCSVSIFQLNAFCNFFTLEKMYGRWWSQLKRPSRNIPLHYQPSNCLLFIQLNSMETRVHRQHGSLKWHTKTILNKNFCVLLASFCLQRMSHLWSLKCHC